LAKKEVKNMSIYMVMTYDLVSGKVTEFQNWLKSDRAKKLSAQLEKETGIKYLNTYMPILGLGDYDCEDWLIAPDWSAFDKIRASKAWDDINIETWDFIDLTRPMKTRIMRVIQETKTSEKPAKKK
jgi:hypothetical protein